MGDPGRPFDIRPTLLMAGFSALLASVLIAGSTILADDVRGTDANQVIEVGAGRVAARPVLDVPSGRLMVAPMLSIQSFALADDVSTQVAGEAVEAPPSGSGEVDEDAAADEFEGGDPIGDEPVPSTAAPVVPQSPSPGSTTAPSVVDDVSTPDTASTPASPPSTTSSTTAPPQIAAPPPPEASTATAPSAPTPAVPEVQAPRVPAGTTATVPASTTSTTQAPAVNGRYSVSQLISGTISAGDGSNPNESGPMGRHDAPLYLPQSWDWAQGPTRNPQWGNLQPSQFAEWRCAVIPEFGHVPPVPFRVNVRNGAYYQFANGSWNKAFDVALDSNDHGAYLGRAGQINNDPFGSGGPGRIEWRREADGSYSAPWNAAALMMHFWAGERRSPAPGQTAEFLTSEIRLQQPDGQTVDLSRVKVLFQCGIDYYNTRSGQGTQVPGPGIATYQRATSSWKPGLWVTLPGSAPADSVADFRTWLNANLPPDVRP